MKLNGISKALEEGCRLHAFRSGGGLRVVRLEKDGKLKGYGEHPHIDDALSHADEDFLAGGRPYQEVYGEGAPKPHYLTGSREVTGDLDNWILQGNTFDAHQDNGNIVVELKGHMQTKIPDNISKRVLATGNTETWEHRGYTYRISRSSFPGNRETCVRSEVIKSPKGRDSSDCWIYEVTKTGKAKDLSEAIILALADTCK